MNIPENEKIYMLSEDDTEEALSMIAMLEGKSVSELCRLIDTERKASCGFARAARVFTIAYVTSYLAQPAGHAGLKDSSADRFRRAAEAVANDPGTLAPVEQ